MSAIIILIGCGFITTIFLFVNFIHNQRRLRKYLNKIPGPPGLPIIGNILDYIAPPDQIWKTLRKSGNEYYPIYKTWHTSYGAVHIRHPDDVEVLLSSTKNITKSEIYNFLHDWFGTGLLTSTGRKWQQRRKILTPAFHFHIIKEFVDVFNREDYRMVEELNSKNSPVTVDLISFITKYTLNTICETAMGTSLSNIELSGDNFQNVYRKSIHDFGEILIYRLSRPWLHSDFIFSLTQLGRLNKHYLKIIRGFSKQIIIERQKFHEDTKGVYLEILEENHENLEKMNFQSSKKKLAMLDLLILAKKNGLIDDNGIQEEVDTFIFEGHDTTAMGICFTLLLLAEHREIQERVRDEVDNVLKNCNGHMGLSDIHQLVYLERCIKEALRLYPSVSFISRRITADMQLNNYLIPVNTTAHVHIYDVHRDPNFWPDPLRYDPDRFLPENSYNRHPYSYIPFSGGLRNCIGQKFGMIELKTMIGHLIHNFYLEPIDLAHEIQLLTDLVLRPKSGARVKFMPRWRKEH